MPLHKQGPDSNGNIYWMLTSAEWSGAVGDALRSQGWRYCGYSATSTNWVGGILVAPEGEPCWTKAAVSGPAILPQAPQDEPAPSQGPPAPSQGPAGPVVDTTCKRCSKSSAAAVSAATSPQAVAAAAARAQAPAGYPWWLFVLAALTLAQVVKNG